MFGHLPEILIVCVIALVVFGPKRVIEMGSSLGKVVRELRESTKDLNISSLITGQEQPTTINRPTTLGMLSQLAQSLTNDDSEEDSAPFAPTTSATTVRHNEPFVESTLIVEQPHTSTETPREPVEASNTWIPGD